MIINSKTISIEEISSLQKELTSKEICLKYKLTETTLNKICEKLNLKFRRTKKKVIDVSNIVDLIYDEVTL